MTGYAYGCALLLSVAILAATGGAWWSDNHWRRKYLSLRRRYGLTIGRPLDFYQALHRHESRRGVAYDIIVPMHRRREL